ncbi:MAG: DUF3147 family protein [Gammaproteobacteria bacterium]
MAYYITKIIITVVLVVIISEISKRSSFIGALLASVPIVSVLAMMWLYVDTHNVERVSALATSVFWLVIPSLALFIALPVLLKKGTGFYMSMGLSIAITICCYFLMIALLHRIGIKL